MFNMGLPFEMKRFECRKWVMGFANLENGDTGFSMGRPACYEDNSVKFSLPLVDERFVYFEISIEFSKYF